MKIITFTVTLSLLSIAVLGQTYTKAELKYRPKTLDEAILQLAKLHHDTTKKQLIAITEDQFKLYSHFESGTWIRNKWKLWSRGKLSKYFNSIGVFHPDDMSGIILTSYYRHLKGQDRELEKQVKYYQDFWEASKDR